GVEAGTPAVAGERADQGMLAAAGTDDKYAHGGEPTARALPGRPPPTPVRSAGGAGASDRGAGPLRSRPAGRRSCPRPPAHRPGRPRGDPRTLQPRRGPPTRRPRTRRPAPPGG